MFLTCSALFTLVTNLSWAFGCFSTTNEPEVIAIEQPAPLTGDILTLQNQALTAMDPVHVVYSHSGNFLSVANGTMNGSISIYKAKKNGLQLIQEVAAGINPSYISYAPKDTFLAVANTNMQPNARGSLIVYQADSTQGTVTKIQTLQAPANPEILNPFAVTYSPDGRFVAVSNQDSINNKASILVYRVTPVSGKWQLIQEYPLVFDSENSPKPWELQYTPDGKFLSVVINDPDTILTLEVNLTTGELSNAQTNSTDLSSPTGIAYSNNGRFAAVTNFDNLNAVVTYSVNSATGTLVRTTQEPVSGATGFPRFVAYSSDDLIAAVTHRTNPGSVTLYCVNQETGEFTSTPVQTLSMLHDPVGIAFAPGHSFAAITERQANKVSLYNAENEICKQ
jgi:6-phosphogluconolactonase (cycloisomerase 2 family)